MVPGCGGLPCPGEAGQKGRQVLTRIFATAVLLLAAAVVASLWMRRSHRRQPSVQLGRFEAARAVTNRWAADPDSTPAPLRDYLHKQRGREQSPDDTEDTGGPR